MLCGKTKKNIHQSFCGVSDSLKRGPEAIWTYLEPIINDIKENYKNIEKIHFFSDGPSTQYRQKNNFFLFAKFISSHFLLGTWNFFEHGHGKGIPDAVGSAIKQSADRRVKYGHDIMSSKELIKQVNHAGTTTKLYEITEAEIGKTEKLLPKTLKPVPGTLKIHQVVVLNNPDELYFRDISTDLHEYDETHTFKLFSFSKGKCTAVSHITIDTNANVGTHDGFNVSVMPGINNPQSCDSEEGHSNNDKFGVVCPLETENNDLQNSLSTAPKTEEIVSISDSLTPICDTNEIDTKTALTQLQTCKTYDDLKTNCEHFNEFLKPLTGKNRALSVERLTPDVFAGRFIPKDVPCKSNLLAVKTRANGDCMFGSGSVFACGKDDDDLVCELRLRVIIELTLYTDYYLDETNLVNGFSHPTKPNEILKAYAMYSDEFDPSNREFDPKSIFIKEIFKSAKQYSYVGIWQMHALASVLGMKIFSMYPKLNSSSEVTFVRKHLNRLLVPRECRSQDVGHILWCNTRTLSPINWYPNHFVPCLPFTI